MAQDRTLASKHLELAKNAIVVAAKTHPSMQLELALWHLREINIEGIDCNEEPEQRNESTTFLNPP